MSEQVPVWRTVEQFIAGVERALSGESVTIESPARVLDRHTQQPREVDVLVRFRSGTVEYLTALECRAHAQPQDVTWIEQASAKRDGIGANKMVLVSTSGFTQPAVLKARQLGIEARTLSEVTHADILQWCVCKTIQLVHTHWSPARVLLLLSRSFNPASGWRLDPEFVACRNADSLNAPVCRVGADRRAVSVADLVNQLEAQGGLLVDPDLIDLHGVATQLELGRILQVGFDPGTAYVPTSAGEAEVAAIDLGLIVKVDVSENAVPLGNYQELRDEQQLVAGVVRGTAETQDTSLDFDLIYGPAAPGGRLAIRGLQVGRSSAGVVRPLAPSPETPS